MQVVIGSVAMDVNILKLLFSSMTLAIVVVGNLVNFFEKYLPSHIAQSFRYGKFAYVGKKDKNIIEVPKKWFKHFYVFASLFSLFACWVAMGRYLLHTEFSSSFILYLDFFGGSNRHTTVEPTSVMLALFLMSAQTLRRFYETWFVSVFSDAKMNLSHYFIGYLHYWGAITAILCEARNFESKDFKLDIPSSQLSPAQVWATVMFAFAWYHQYRCAVILANTRKDSKGNVKTVEHKIPQGGPFKYLSSPHLTCEVLIYLSLTVILQGSSTFPYVFFWVLSNQLETAFLSHWWYKATFKNYPKEKKVFVPFLL